MNHIWSIAAKELRGYFNSAVALIFLATFLGVVLYTFFWVDTFFARGLADIRPLFEWLPLLLVFLVAALTMRLWSEEQKTGTLEILLTLPVPIHRLVLGKFLGGFLLVAIALALTLGLPLTVNHLGELDWGPVFGGYLAALLLAGTYLAIGLCVSATTENQIVALIGTIAVGLLLYLPGVDAVAGLFGVHTGEILRAIGTGSRFESIARGVLDIRDLAYYASLISAFLVLNVVILRAKGWGTGERSRRGRTNTLATAVLVVANVLALNVWLAPVHSARVDLTAGGYYSLSPATERMLRSLDEPLVIRGFFSDTVHEKIDPLVPQLRDLLEEYQIVGGDKVRLSFVNPGEDEELAKELEEEYNIKNRLLEQKTRHAQSLIKAYFHVLIEYGDQHEVLTIEDFIPVEARRDDDIRLVNAEYALTKTIRKVVLGFNSVEAMFGSLTEDVKLEAYVTPDSLPKELAEVYKRLDSVVESFKRDSGGRFTFEKIEPKADADRKKLFQEYGIQPFTSLFSQSYYYSYLLLHVGERYAAIPIIRDYTEAELRETLTSTLQRAAPGFIKTVGLVTPPPGPPQQVAPNRPPQPGPPPQQFQQLQRALQDHYEVQSVTLSSGQVPDDIDVLILAGPENLADKDRRAVDQYLMRGGSVIALVGKYRLDRQRLGSAGELAVEQVQSGIDDMLASWGVEVGAKLVADPHNEEFIDLVALRESGRQPNLEKPYPFFPKIPRSVLEEGGIVTADLGPTVLHYTTTAKVVEPGKGEDKDDKGDGEGEAADARPTVHTFLTSSDESWLHTGSSVEGNYRAHPELGIAPPGADTEHGPYPLAVALVGTFHSTLKGKDAGAAGPGQEASADQTYLERSPPDARLVVVASSDFVSDAMLGLSEQLRLVDIANNVKFVQNLIDWSVEDTDLLSIRAQTSASTLEVQEDDRLFWEIVNYIIALIGLILVIGASWVMRKPTIVLASVKTPSPAAAATDKAAKAAKAAKTETAAKTAKAAETAKAAKAADDTSDADADADSDSDSDADSDSDSDADADADSDADADADADADSDGKETV